MATGGESPLLQRTPVRDVGHGLRAKIEKLQQRVALRRCAVARDPFAGGMDLIQRLAQVGFDALGGLCEAQECLEASDAGLSFAIKCDGDTGLYLTFSL